MNIFIEKKSIVELNFDIPLFFTREALPENSYNDDLDKIIDDFLERLDHKYDQINSITIPISLSENFLEFSGIRLAYHVRLTRSLKFCDIPIIFIGSSDSKYLLKIDPILNIINTVNVCYIDITKCDFDGIKETIEEIDNKLFNFERFLNFINLDPPANYDSHHSVENELTLLRWCEYLQCDNKIPNIKSKIKTSLYFKFRMALNPLAPLKFSNRYLFSEKSKILLIDDEGIKGWHFFYKFFFEISSHLITYESLDIDFKNASQCQIVKASVDKVFEFNADVVLLDLRLLDDDFNSSIKTKELSGIKILSEIKSINKGIQVLIISASNKIWSYEECIDLGSDGYIVKNSDLEVSETVKLLKDKINKCILRANYLKKTYSNIDYLVRSLESLLDQKEIDEKFGKELIGLFKISYQLYESAKEEIGFAYAYLALFKCLELIATEHTFQIKGVWNIVGPSVLKQYSWSEKTNNYLCESSNVFNTKDPSTFEKIAGLCFQKWGMSVDFVRRIYYSIKIRNEFIHPSGKKLEEKLELECKIVFMSKGFQVLMCQIKEICEKIIMIK